MTRILQGKVAIVTGGSSGIGRAIAKRFVAEGAFVFVTGRRQAELDSAVDEIGGNVKAIRADASNLADLDRVYETIRTDKGRIDIVVANAGILEHAPIGSVTAAHFDRVFSVNVRGLLFTVQKALPLMLDGGAVVLMSSTVAGKGLGGSSVYAATKAAIRSFARTWIVDLKDRRIRVNVISPGPIGTPGLTGAAPDAAALTAMMERMAAQVPLGRVGDPDEIARTALFLASEASSFVNGANIEVDGGWAQI
ncbi:MULTISPECIES: glucose 1-dehydrogenase [unclassified Methylobacterium]|uniref:SDR family NAD(P)-dependent oxidoreductase n=1 Tax=unclassified Methylobacterium TaxID=2615210 RepID=UPI002269EDA1|nr:MULTISPECIES: glucose 1-dehydrogenase [unclassified Methylobacterium]